MPPLGHLTAATVWTHLGDQIEVTDSAAKNEILLGVAKSCVRQDPITLTGGFKAWYICQVDVSERGGPSRTMESRGFLTPQHIGEPVPVSTVHNGRTWWPTATTCATPTWRDWRSPGRSSAGSC